MRRKILGEKTQNIEWKDQSEHVIMVEIIVLYKMVAQNMVRTYEVKPVFSDTIRIWRLSRCNQMPSATRNAWFTPYERIVKWATI